MDVAVHIAQLTVAYGPRVALDAIDVTIHPGVTGILGPNGAGKSSLLRCLATAQRPSAGHIHAWNLELTQPSHQREARRRIGYLPQDPGFYPRFRVAEFTDHVAILKEIAPTSRRRTEVERVLSAVGLADRSRDRIKSLSGGMRQRLALACAMLGSPDLLILDEPTVGLDPQQRAQFREVVAEAGRTSTLVLSTHQTEDIAAVCGRVVVLQDGRLHFDGTPGELIARAHGRVWLEDRRAPGALASWSDGSGLHRNVGDPPPAAQLAAPTLEDGYLVLTASADSSIAGSR